MSAAGRAHALALAGLLALGCGGGAAHVQRAEHFDASLQIDEMSVRHGEIRIAGDIDVDPRASDVELVDGACGKRVLGRGMWTRNRLVWRLSPRDLSFAFGCESTVGVRARNGSWAGRAGGVSHGFPLALALNEIGGEDQRAPAATNDISIDYDLDDAIIRVKTDVDPSSLVLSVPGETAGPALASSALEAAVFRVKSASLVDAALRGQMIRITGGGRETRWLPALSIANQTVIAEESPEPASDPGG